VPGESRFYLESIISCLNAIEHDESISIEKAASLLAEKVASGRLINVIGPGGHSTMGVEEVFWRAGSLACVNPLLDPGTNLICGAKRSNVIERTPGYAGSVIKSYRLKEGDVLIIVNAYGINSMCIECALESEAMGIETIAVTSASFGKNIPAGSSSRHPSGKNLFDLCDIFINNHLPYGDAVVKVGKNQKMMGPHSTFLNCFVMNLLMMETAKRLEEMSIDPPVYVSANLPDGDKVNKELEEKYIPLIKHLL
jgi:uncharacterized phosphosugar-binding protein